MTSDTRPAETTTEAPARHCATCGQDESEQVRFGVDRYHCLSCVAARIREWRRRRKQAQAAEAAGAEALPEAAPETIQIGVVRTSQVSLALEGYLAATGRSWLEVASEAKVDRGQVHRILMAATPTTERQVADALLRTIGADPASIPTLAEAR